MIFAQIENPPVPWPVTGNWFLGLIGVLAVVYLVLGVAWQCKKLFGTHPPLEEQFRGEIDALQTEMDERFRELALERARNICELSDKINRVGEDVAFIRGKMAKEN